MKKSVLLGLAASCAVVLSACGGGNSGSTADSGSTGDSGKSSPSGEQVLNLVESSEMPSADISLATDTVSFEMMSACYEGLYRVNAKQELEPAGAAEMAKANDDGTVYTFQLNKDAKWSNGDPVTAADYVYSWQRTVSPDTGSEYAYLFECIKNAADITAGKKDVSELGVKAVGDYELEVTLQQATPYFPYLMAFGSFFPQNQKVVEKYGDQYAMNSDNAVYNGPFTLTDFDGPGSDTDWSFTKNDNYWDKDTVKLDKVNVSVVKEVSTAVNMFEDGQVDDVTLSGELAQQKANDPAYIVEQQGSTFYAEMNQRDADSPYKNENLRKALSASIDRKTYVKNILANGSTASTGLVPKNLAFDSDGKDFTDETDAKVEYSVKKAAEYWKKAKEELGIDSLTINLVADDTDAGKKTTEYLQGAIQDALDGVTVKVSNVPFSVRLDRGNKGDFDMIIGGWGADYADPSSFTDLFTSENSYNRGRWSNADYDKLIEEAATTNANDPEKRWQNLLDAENTIVGEAGVIPIYQKAEAHLRAPKVKGVVAHASGVDHDYKWAYIDDSAK